MTRPSFATFETHGAIIHRLPLQAFPKFWAYAYVVIQDDRRILIDTGSGTDTSHADLLTGLTKANLQPQDLTHILLTHAHIDHYGGLSKLKPLTSARIGCHELDMQTVAYHEARLALISRRLAYFLAETGLAKEEVDSLLNIYRFTKALYTSVPVDFVLRQAQDGVYGSEPLPFEFIHLPGHCPGHVAFKINELILCGDMVVEGVTPHISPESITPYSGLDHYLASLRAFQAWAEGARLILNGHDAVITDLSAAVDATRKNILRRMGKAVETLAKPGTILEVCNAVYENPGGYTQLLALEKTGAYLEYLYEHALVEIVNADEVNTGLPAKYRAFASAMPQLEKAVAS